MDDILWNGIACEGECCASSIDGRRDEATGRVAV